MSDDELREQMALYAVGALTGDERAELEDAVGARPDLRAELDELVATADVLADTVPAAPPPALRGRVLDAIAGVPQLPHEARAVAPVVPITSGRRRRRFAALGAAAAAVVAIVVGVLVVSPWGGGQDPVAAVVEASDAREVPMPGTGAPGSLEGVTIVHSASEGASVLLADDVPIPDGDRVYELWAIRDGAPQRYVTFRPDEDGRLSVYAPGLDPTTAEQWALTEEPAGGSEVPTTPILNAT